MIDLRHTSLPDTIKVDGEDFLIETDFREWLKFSELIKENRSLSDYIFLLKEHIPTSNFFDALVEFYSNPNSTPRSVGSGSTEELVDYIQDGEYIVASFMQDYGIDLTSCKMHWHLFKALFVGLSDKTKIKQIMSMRAYRKSNKSYEAQCIENKKIWKLNQSQVKADKELMADINALFYGSVYRK
jgi:hypothetical protein